MSYRTILVQLDLGATCAIRVDLAAALAARFDAHLVGLHTAPPPDVPPAIEGMIGADLARERDAALLHLAAHSAERFETRMRVTGIEARSEFRVAGDDPLDATIRHARYADLVIVGQTERPAPDGVFTPASYVERLVLGAGRPVLVVPAVGRNRSVGEKVVIAWSPRREAARAVRDALPFLSGARTVTLLSINPIETGGHGETPGSDVATYLARHDVPVRVESVAAASIDPVDIGVLIARHALTLDADLVVMGAYGRSRWRELVLGGATRSMLARATLPVLYSH